MSPRVMEIRSRIEPCLTPRGVDLEELSVTPVGRREIVRVVVDRDGGVDLDLIAELSTEIATALDEVGSLFPGAYVLEVTSPGVDRPLTEPRHWRRAVGRLVTVQCASRSPVHGRLVRAGDSDATVQVPGEGEVRIEFVDVTEAHVEIEFDRREEGE